MDKEKKYYWLKLKDDFFNNREIKKLRRVSGGDTFTIIYLKMLLLSIKQGGLIKYMETEENLAEQLSLELDEAIEDVKLTLSFLQANALIENISKDEYLLNKVPELIGSETSAAERMRKMRNRNNVTPLLQNVTQRKRKEIEKDIYSSSANYNASEIEEVLPNENDNSILLATNEKKQQHEKEIIDNNKLLFDYWNSKKIVVHKTLNEELNNSISKFLKKHKLAEFKIMVDRYKKVLDDKKYFFSYIWSLKDFLNRKNGAVDFADDGSKWQDYCLKVGVESKQEFTETQEGVFKI